MRHTFPKSEKLTSKKAIESLFEKGHSKAVFPFKILWDNSDPEQVFPKLAFSVPKRRFPKAVDRNAIKRKLREVYRLQKEDFIKAMGCSNVNAMVIFIGKKNLPFEKLQEKWIALLQEIEEHEVGKK